MYSNIEAKVADIIYENTKSHEAFYELGFDDNDFKKLNEIPGGVTDIDMAKYCTDSFLDSFKKIIENKEWESANLMVNKMVECIDKQHEIYPTNPNNNKFSSTSGTSIIKSRVMQMIDEKFLAQ